METGAISISKMQAQEPMVVEGDEIDEVNKSAEEVVKRGSVLQASGVDDDDAITDGRREGLSEANLPKSNCKLLIYN